jgi:glycosyltransferase involved in cell wall biosynthesis
MRILVFAHHLELGGSQVNAIELAAAVSREHGHDVAVFASAGPALDLVREHGLRFIEAPRARVHPSPAVMAKLRRTVVRERIDLVHAWEWPQCLDAFYALQMAGTLPILGSNMSMTVTRFLPRCLPVTYGTPSLVEEARRWHRAPVELLEPPVDIQRNRPDAVDPTSFRSQHRIKAGAATLVIVSRLTSWLKLEGLQRSMEAVAVVASERPIRLIVVGGGPAYDSLAALAKTINARLGSDVVVLTGPMTDPRPAYAAATLVLGMGSSLLRGLAFAKPCLILGEAGFSEPFTPETSARFLRDGFYGLGDGDLSPLRLADQIRQYLDSGERLSELGAFGRRLVEQRFSLEVGAAALQRLYERAAASPVSRPRAIAEGFRSGLHRAGAWAVPRPIKRRMLEE